LKRLFVVFDGSVYFSDFVKSKAAVEDGFEVQRVEFNCFVVVLDSLLELLLFASLPPMGVKDVSLPQRVVFGKFRLRENDVTERYVFIVSG